MALRVWPLEVLVGGQVSPRLRFYVFGIGPDFG